MSHLVFKPLAEDLTRLLDEFSTQFQVVVGENGLPIGGGPTIGERLFITHIYDYISRFDHSLTFGFARLLESLAKSGNVQTSFLRKEDDSIETIEIISADSHIYEMLAHRIITLEKYNSRLRSERGDKCADQVILCLCPECGAVIAGTRNQPSVLCSAACRVSKSRSNYLDGVETRSREGLKTALSVTKLISHKHALATWQTIVDHGELCCVTYFGKENPPEGEAGLDFVRNFCSLEAHELENDTGLSDWFNQFDVSAVDCRCKDTTQSVNASSSHLLERATSELLDQYGLGEVGHFTKTSERLRAEIRELDPDNPLGYSYYHFAKTPPGTRVRRITDDTSLSLVKLKNSPKGTWELAVPDQPPTYLSKTLLEDFAAEVSKDEFPGQFPAFVPGFAIQYRVRSTGTIVPSIIDLYALISDTIHDDGMSPEDAYLYWASRLDVTKIQIQTDGSLREIGPLVDEKMAERDARISFHLQDVTTIAAQRIVALLHEKGIKPLVDSALPPSRHETDS